MPDQDPILGLRDTLFTQDRLLEAQSALPPDHPALALPGHMRALGVVMEIGLEQLTVMVAGYINGDARLLYSTGGGLLGNLYEYPEVATAARNLVATARNLLTYTALETMPRPLPAANIVRFTLLTLQERRVVEVPGPEIAHPNHPFHPLFQAATLLSDELHKVLEQLKNGTPPGS